MSPVAAGLQSVLVVKWSSEPLRSLTEAAVGETTRTRLAASLVEWESRTKQGKKKKRDKSVIILHHPAGLEASPANVTQHLPPK